MLQNYYSVANWTGQEIALFSNLEHLKYNTNIAVICCFYCFMAAYIQA